MAFWGIEVKPGKPVTHSFDYSRGRLRISQATLGIGNAETRSLVQCNVGNKSPVFLCALLPNKTESCHLDLEFEEADDVVFSVLGPRTVYLTGYYVGKSRQANANSDTESYGEDIADTETGESCRNSDEDKYDDSFINDGEPEISAPSPASSSGVQVDDENLSENKLHNNKGSHKRLRKKYRVSESEDEDILQEVEDEDNCLLSSLKKKADVKAKTSKDNRRNDMISAEVPHKTENGGTLECVNAKLVIHSEHGLENGINSNKKRKQPEGKLLEVYTSSSQGKDTQYDEAKLVDASQALIIDMKDGQFDTLEPPAEEFSKHGPKSKKRKHSAEAKSCEGHDTSYDIILKEGQLKQDPLEAGHLREASIAIAIEEEDKKVTINKSVDGKPDSVADGCQLDEKLKKKKKKKTKTQKEDCMVKMDVPVLQENEMNRQSMHVEDKNLKAKSTVIKTLSNGLTIEECATGEPEGKLAAPGKKIKVYYTGKLKENGQVFYTNIGKSPYKFRLGDKDIIEGWNLGLDGMRVGGKRRLTVPPSMGYGSEGAGENIPPNSWLVYDIELIGVRR